MPPTSAPAPSRAKAQLRAEVLARRRSLPHLRRRTYSAQIVAQMRACQRVRQSTTVLAFAPFGDEVGLDPLLRWLLARDVALHLPWVDGHRLGVARVEDLRRDLLPGWRGLREPAPRNRGHALRTPPDLVLVPLVAFDAAGGRLGYGRGYYDRLLTGLPPATPRVGVAFACQEVASVPTTPHDVALHAVATETGITWCAH